MLGCIVCQSGADRLHGDAQPCRDLVNVERLPAWKQSESQSRRPVARRPVDSVLLLAYALLRFGLESSTKEFQRLEPRKHLAFLHHYDVAGIVLDRRITNQTGKAAGLLPVVTLAHDLVDEFSKGFFVHAHIHPRFLNSSSMAWAGPIRCDALAPQPPCGQTWEPIFARLPAEQCTLLLTRGTCHARRGVRGIVACRIWLEIVEGDKFTGLLWTAD